jgi:CMP-N-acetylneuraminic acid synthetase
MTPMNEVLLNSVNQIEADYYLQTHSTNPLLHSASISGAINEFMTNLPEHDSLFSVTRLQTRLWSSRTEPLNHNPSRLLRTQDLEPVFEENSCMYLFNKASLEKHKNRIGARPLMYEIDKLEAQDIDTEQDFTLAETLYKQITTQGLD